MHDYSSTLGIVLILFGGAANGSFAVPTKKVTLWSFEHIWLVYCVVAMILLPIGLGAVVAPVLFARVFPAHPILTAQAFGFGTLFGGGSVLFALSLKRLGIAISDALTNGTVVLFGSTGPLLIGAVSLTPAGILRFAIGLSLLIIGIFACAWASVARDKTGNQEMRLAPLITPWLGISLAVLAGVVSSMLNIGFAHGRPLTEMAMEAGVVPIAASLAIWIPALIGGFFVNLIFTSFEIQRSKSWSKFAEGDAGLWVRSSSMGLLWFTAISIYGMASPMLGHAGSVYGWAIDAGASILTSSSWGFALGEWENATWRAKRLLLWWCEMEHQTYKTEAQVNGDMRSIDFLADCGIDGFTDNHPWSGETEKMNARRQGDHYVLGPLVRKLLEHAKKKKIGVVFWPTMTNTNPWWRGIGRPFRRDRPDWVMFPQGQTLSSKIVTGRVFTEHVEGNCIANEPFWRWLMGIQLDGMRTGYFDSWVMDGDFFGGGYCYTRQLPVEGARPLTRRFKLCM